MWDKVSDISITGEVSWPYDCIIYLHGSTCETDIGLTLTLAHELQHFVQYAISRPLWAVHTLLSNLPGLPKDNLQGWKDFPLEKEARVVAKRIAEKLFGADPVSDYIKGMIDAHLTDGDAIDWAFIQGINCSLSYDATEETKHLVRLYKRELSELQKTLSSPRDADISGVNLDDWEN
jgi:hypothetical protein